MITTAQLAASLQIAEKTVSQYAKNGRFPGAVKVGNKWRFPDDVLERMAAPKPAPIVRPRKRRAA